jgi:hypothetical protein
MGGNHPGLGAGSFESQLVDGAVRLGNRDGVTREQALEEIGDACSLEEEAQPFQQPGESLLSQEKQEGAAAKLPRSVQPPAGSRTRPRVRCYRLPSTTTSTSMAPASDHGGPAPTRECQTTPTADRPIPTPPGR